MQNFDADDLSIGIKAGRQAPFHIDPFGWCYRLELDIQGIHLRIRRDMQSYSSPTVRFYSSKAPRLRL